MKFCITSQRLAWRNCIGLIILGSMGANIPLAASGLEGSLQPENLLAQTSQSTVEAEASDDTQCQGNECADPIDRAWAQKDAAGAGSNSSDGGSSSGGSSSGSSGGGASGGGAGGGGAGGGGAQA